MCTTLVDYGDFRPSSRSFEPLIDPAVKRFRDSDVVRKYFRPESNIPHIPLRDANVLLIPTIYQSAGLYGPQHAYEGTQYHRWHMTLASILPHVTIKSHPKNRWPFPHTYATDSRRLEDCINEYDVLLFDFFSTGAVLAITSDKPVIYFDIGLRNLRPEFLASLRKRCTIITIVFDEQWGEQVRTGLDNYEREKRTHSNIGLEKYSLCKDSSFSLSTLLLDIIRSS